MTSSPSASCATEGTCASAPPASPCGMSSAQKPWAMSSPVYASYVRGSGRERKKGRRGEGRRTERALPGRARELERVVVDVPEVLRVGRHLLAERLQRRLHRRDVVRPVPRVTNMSVVLVSSGVGPGGETHPSAFQPSVQPLRVHWPIAGDLSSYATASSTTSSGFTPRSSHSRIVPSTVMSSPSGSAQQ
ncbi:hypothetical protein OH77DRAFT_1426312 [Trametes cingulata]|nr:hypothetical protein OH77DRAFT_1426312 [Trametes cingulata]